MNATYEIVKGSARTSTSWKSGSMQRGSGTRWYIVDASGTRVITADQLQRKGFGYMTRKAAEEALAEIMKGTN